MNAKMLKILLPRAAIRRGRGPSNLLKPAAFIALAAAAMAAGGLCGATAAPSFDCKRATSIVEKEICGSAEFSDLDRDIAASFTAALAVLGTAAAAALRADQRAWLKIRDDCGALIHGDPPIYADVYVCVRDQLKARAARLHAIVTTKTFSK
jgi:uncharacterized protein YecT (DUF1311 family)